MAKTEVEKKKKSKRKKKSQAEVSAERFPKKLKKRQQVPKGDVGGMKLLLIENVQHVGNQGDVVEVKPGFGRNYLIPQGLATFVTPETLARTEKHRAKIEALRIAKLADLKMLARELEKQSITIEANANEEGHLYGSVSAIDIAKALQKEKFDIGEDHVRLEGPIKELGLYHVAVHLAPEVDTDVKVWVVPMADPQAAVPDDH